MSFYANHVTWFWSHFCNSQKRSRLVGLSAPYTPMLCLKDLLMEDDPIFTKLLRTVGVVSWNKLLECWQLKDKKNAPLAINNYLLKINSVTVIYTIYLYGNCLTFCVIWKKDRQKNEGAVFLCLSIFQRVRLLLQTFIFLFSLLWHVHQISSLI